MMRRLRAASIALAACALLATPSHARAEREQRRASDEIARGLIVDALEPAAGAPSTVVVLVRHAEKRTQSDDPGLTRRGRRRAARLARLLDHDHPRRSFVVDRLFASEYRRTQRTLEPLAREAGRFVEVRPGRAVDGLAQELRGLGPGTLAVVAGHSNTVPAIVRALGAELELRELPEDAYDRLFVVVLPPPDSGGPVVLHELRFDP